MSNVAATSVLVIGFGNPAREDDALGPTFANTIEEMGLEGVTVDSDYQLMVEDAADAAEHDFVLFVDANTEGDEPFVLKRIVPVRQGSFSSHSVSPEAILALAHDLFGASTEAYILGIRGISFGMFTETMTDQAQSNFDAALEFIVPVIKSRTFDQAAE